MGNQAGSTYLVEPFEPFFLFTYLDASGSAITEGQQASDILVLLGIGLVSFCAGTDLLPDPQTDCRGLALAAGESGSLEG